jgi:hypothetical protein
MILIKLLKFLLIENYEIKTQKKVEKLKIKEKMYDIDLI